ncbi:MAG: NUDIX domain-containing protein [Gammaproteobacteria bacterium]|nr:NUDIX domain-containing protein [Gammaproteobacteria bacterium]
MAAADDEILDVVDANDDVVGEASRADVHANGLRHRSVHVLVVNTSGKVLTQRRGLHKDCDPGLWDTSAAGHVGRGERYETAARRELYEELGLEGLRLHGLCQLPADPRTGFEFVHAYLCVTDLVPVPAAEEIEDIAWHTSEDLRDRMSRDPSHYTDSIKLIFSVYLNSLRTNREPLWHGDTSSDG